MVPSAQAPSSTQSTQDSSQDSDLAAVQSQLEMLSALAESHGRVLSRARKTISDAKANPSEVRAELEKIVDVFNRIYPPLKPEFQFHLNPFRHQRDLKAGLAAHACCDSPGSDAPPPKPVTVSERLLHQEKLMGELQEAVSLLRNKLDPVIRESTPAVARQEPERTPDEPSLSLTISALNEELAEQISRIRWMIDALNL